MNEIINNLSVILPAILLIGFAAIIALLFKKDDSVRMLLIIIPTIVSTTTFIGSLYGAVNNNLDVVNLGVAIIGVAVTVWLSINIYNVIEKNEIKDMLNDNKKFKEEQEKIINDLKKEHEENIQSFKSNMSEEKKKLEDQLLNFLNSECGIAVSKIKFESDETKKTQEDLIRYIKGLILEYCYSNKIIIAVDLFEYNEDYIHFDLRSTEELVNSLKLIKLRDHIFEKLKINNISAEVTMPMYVTMKMTF